MIDLDNNTGTKLLIIIIILFLLYFFKIIFIPLFSNKKIIISENFMDLRTKKAIENEICRDPYIYSNSELPSCTQSLLDQHEIEKGPILTDPDEIYLHKQMLDRWEEQSKEFESPPPAPPPDLSFCTNPIVQERIKSNIIWGTRDEEDCWTRFGEKMECEKCCASGFSSTNSKGAPCWSETDPNFARCCSHPTREERDIYEEKQKQLAETTASPTPTT